jgi:hypothetical protein
VIRHAAARDPKGFNFSQYRTKRWAGGSAFCQKITPLQGKNRRGFGVQSGAQCGAKWCGAIASIREPKC